MGKVELRLEIDAELLADAEARGLSLDRVLEDGLRAALSDRTEFSLLRHGSSDAEAARRWAEENAEAIASHKKFIEEYGAFGEDMRTW